MVYISQKKALKLRKRNLYLCGVVFCFVLSVSIIAVSVYFVFRPVLKDEPEKKLNVLFIVVDDLRPTLGCYGDDMAITPNIDYLASKSVLFANAFAQQALCAPSRTSFLTSRRPDSLHLYDNLGSYFRDAVWNFTTLPQHFKYNGYETVSIGKVFHHGSVSNKTDDYPYSWSRIPYHPSTLKEKMSKVCPSPDGNQMNIFCPVDVDSQIEKTLPDIQVAEEAVNFLKNRSNSLPFFLGLGFYKPHIPFKFPLEYLDLYPFDDMNLAKKNTRPELMPDVAWNPWMDLRERNDVKNLNISFPFGPIPDDFQKRIRQGYYASVSYMDDQLGKVLDALDSSGYAENTVIVFFGDHGWSLGEHGEWAKYSNFEVALKVPLLVYIPGVTAEANVKFSHINVSKLKRENYNSLRAKYTANEFVELVDLFPTLADIAKLPVPFECPVSSSYVTFCSEGLSFYNVIKHHLSSSSELDWKSAIFAQYPRPSPTPANNSDQPILSDIQIMGYTMRTHYFRYTRWMDFNNTFFSPSWSEKSLIDEELYDEAFDKLESFNLKADSFYKRTLNHLFKRLRNGWREALPEKIFGT